MDKINILQTGSMSPSSGEDTFIFHH